MSATTEDRSTSRRDTHQVNLDVAAATTIPAGVIVAANTSGYAVNAADTAGLRAIGVALERVDNSAGSAGDLDIEVGRACYLLANDSGTALTIADIGKPCYVLDNQTVSGAAGSNAVVAGLVHDVTSDGVWVDFGAYTDTANTAGLSVAVANAGTPDGDAYVTIQSSVRARQVLRVWFAATAYAAPADLGTLTATTGVILKEDTDDALATVVTDATGLAVLNLDLASDGTVHCMAERNGLCATDSEAITGN